MPWATGFRVDRRNSGEASVGLATAHSMDWWTCPVCLTAKQKFYCKDCCKSTILDPVLPAISSLNQDNVVVTTQLNALLAHRPQTGITRSKEREFVHSRLAELEKRIEEYKKETIELQTRVHDLHSHVHYRREQIETHRTHALASHAARLQSVHQSELAQLTSKYSEVCEVLVQSRKVLVRELCGVLSLRRARKEGSTANTQSKAVAEHGHGATTNRHAAEEGFVGDLPCAKAGNGAVPPSQHRRSHSGSGKRPTPLSSATPGSRPSSDRSTREHRDDIVIVNVTFPTNGDFWNYSRDEFNTGVGYIAHMTKLVTSYLGVGLPFEMELQGSKSFARANHPETTEARKTPMYLTPTNSDEFLIGFAMMCFNVAYLCHTQGMKVGLSNVRDVLRNLYMCCHGASLGRDLDVPLPLRTDASFHATLDSSFPLDFSKVVKDLRSLKATAVGGQAKQGEGNRGQGKVQEDFEFVDRLARVENGEVAAGKPDGGGEGWDGREGDGGPKASRVLLLGDEGDEDGEADWQIL
ncbi:hypothetical protein M427DRAFT_220314 [Gonapodya prolifera JEL478]|uniref:Autophagy-related protein 14 n=1 Tax=Gonapodya prolifera (strain JEL478) TaxID=1344416 RepID=A0A138ZYK4_GONPJ|nr:hypothetical protein M427DRAFT_220314 [Gonapodya prolifera JEL478]|eukprot:KXS09586.1 hypothetical protein M427DRAFT_220314 [Gonapodya prolifera JEL478]